MPSVPASSVRRKSWLTGRGGPALDLWSSRYAWRARMPEIAIEPRPGDNVGPYRITRTIGRGRMGVVFEGVIDGQDPVAIKVVTTELSQDEVFVRRFKREVAAAQKISHPNVVPVLGAGEQGGLPYLVQALIAGGSLHDRLGKDGSLHPATQIPAPGRPAAG